MHDRLPCPSSAQDNTGYSAGPSPSVGDLATSARSGAPSHPAAIIVDIVTPIDWSVESFWCGTKGRAFGLVLAIGLRSWTIGAEWFGGEGKACGVALILGPFWLGFATSVVTEADDQ